MKDEEKQRIMTEARHIYLAAPVLMPLIEKMKKVAFDRLMAKHRDGDTKYETLVSELSVLNNLEREINVKVQLYEEMK